MVRLQILETSAIAKNHLCLIVYSTPPQNPQVLRALVAVVFLAVAVAAEALAVGKLISFQLLL